MEQEYAVNKAMRCLKEQEALPEEDNLIFKKYLNWMYVVGYEAGNKAAYCNNPNRKHTEVQQYDLKGNKTKKYGSAAEAARENHCSTDTIFTALKKNRPTKSGHYYTRVD